MNFPMSKYQKIILIDDDNIQNLLCRLSIKAVDPTLEVVEFTEPEVSLDYTREHLEDKTLVLLDINMPYMTGWDWLDQFDHIGPQPKDRIDIYILSSSIDPRDKEKARENHYVKEYLVKPLSKETIQKILN